MRDLCVTCAQPLSDLGLSYPSTLSCQGKLIVLFRLSPGPTLPHLVSDCGVRGWTPACSVSAACSNPGLRSHRRCLKSSWSHRMSGDHWGYSPFGVSGSAALSLLKSWVLLVHKWCELAEVWSATALFSSNASEQLILPTAEGLYLYPECGRGEALCACIMNKGRASTHKVRYT